MIATLFAAGLLLLPSANAFWRLPCAKPVLNARVDPIVSPGAPSGHSHTIMGSNAIGFDTTFESLRNSECSTCMVKDDKSAYWTPQLFYEYKNGTFEAVDHGGMTVYYLQRMANNETVEAFPDGLRILTGNPLLRSNPQNAESKAISWTCINFNGPAVPQTPYLGNTNCPDGLRAQVFFPGCWDGVNLDSPDHKSHMAYPDGIDNGLCPPTHPHHLISIFYEVLYSVAPFNALNDGGRFLLSNGDPTGYSLHGDFMNGWDRSVLSRAVATCTDNSGVIENCPVFKNENRFYTNDENKACSAPNPLLENVDPNTGILFKNLPGCNPITEGPTNATEGALAPGCVPAGKNGSVVPVSEVPSSAAPSSASKLAASGAAQTMPLASPSNAPAKNASAAAAVAASSNKMSPSPNSVPVGTSAPAANQLAASTAKLPASTFTTNLAAASNILHGASTVPVSAAPSSASGKKSGQCKRAGSSLEKRDANLSAHRRSRTQRGHGSN